MTVKKNKTTTQLNHLEPRAHEKNACVARVKCARCGVLSTSESSREPLAQGLALIAKETFEHENLPIQGESRSIVHGQEIFQVRRIQVHPKRQPG